MSKFKQYGANSHHKYIRLHIIYCIFSHLVLFRYVDVP